MIQDFTGINFEEFETPREERNHTRNLNKEAKENQPEDSATDTTPPEATTSEAKPSTRDGGFQYSPVKDTIDPKDAMIKELQRLLKEEKDKLSREKLKTKRLQEQVNNPSPAIIKRHLTLALEDAKIPSSQIRCIVHKKKYTWLRNDPEGLAKAAVEYAIDHRLYEHIRNQPGSLWRPHRTTLGRHFEHFQVTPGMQDDCIDVLETMLKTTKKKLYEHALIAFDEVAIKGDEVEMDKRTQRVYGPHSKMQVVSIRGLGPK